MPQQVAMVMPILEGLDGQKKMSKSLGNYVALTDAPTDMFGKLMSVSDELMVRYYDVLFHEQIPMGKHPMDAKKGLAGRVVARFNGEKEAKFALEDFNMRFSARNLDEADLPVFVPAGARATASS